MLKSQGTDWLCVEREADAEMVEYTIEVGKTRSVGNRARCGSKRVDDFCVIAWIERERKIIDLSRGNQTQEADIRN